MAREGFLPVLKKSRWLLLKCQEAFQQLWDHNPLTWAGKVLDQWWRRVMRFRIDPTKKIARPMRQDRKLILNYRE